MTMIKYLLILLCVHNSFEATDKVLCYYTDWSIYRTGGGAFSPDDIDANVCTHVIYAFLGLQQDGTVVLVDAWSDVDLEGFSKVNALKETNPNLKTILSVGGYNAGNAILTGIAATPEYRQNLISSSTQLFQQYGFDGLDIDWEYPVANDRDNFITLLREIKQAYQPQGYFLTIAVSAIPIDDAYDVPGMSQNVDIINLMTYDFHTAGAGVTGQNSPLYAGSSDNDWQKAYENVNSTVINWIELGADPQKLVIGLGFYGHTFTLSDSSDHGVGVPVSGAGHQGPYTKNDGTLGYNEICELAADWERVWDDEQKVPYKFNGDQWVGYDDEESIALKVQFAKSQNIGGVMIWSVDTDDLQGLCGRPRGLLEAIKDNL